MTDPHGGPQGVRRLSTRTYLLALIAAAVVPLLAFAGFLLTRHVATERARFEEDAARIARQVALVVDGELNGLIALLKGLAASSALLNDDFAQFHAEAKLLVGSRDELIVLRDAGQRQFLNTQRPFGTELPPAVPLAAQHLAFFSKGQPWVSDVYASPLSKEARIAVALPVLRAGKPEHILGLTVPTSRIRDALLPAVPEGWIVGIGDNRGIYLTRSVRHDEYTGKPGLPEYIAKATGRAGTFTSVNFEGTKLLAGYYHSDLSGWLFGANVPYGVVEAPLRRSLAALAVLGLAALMLTILLAYRFGRSFTNATTALAQRAEALGKGDPVAPMPSRLTEFASVSDALASAARSIEEKARERDLLIAELNHRVKNTLAIVQSIAFQTLRGRELGELRDALGSRLHALAKAHDVLTRQNWEGAHLHDVVQGAVTAHGDLDRFQINGPRVWLTPSLSVLMAMILHELATNAVKYGALGADGGTVSIAWETAEDRDRLTLRWIERGGPSVQAPTTQGFGSRLLEGSISGVGGKASVDYAADGVTCLIELPLRPESEQTGDPSIG